MFGFGDRARAPQSSKARQWVEVREWWFRLMVLANACEYTPGHSPPPSERRSHLFISTSTNACVYLSVLLSRYISDLMRF
ncbi:hypothetical protein AGABI1DRAFT_131829 [Agaricus bisporus var. burnettii JB137-S8]|uniref:Uncharacterized protein n=1 Tax=Agaricus bisporus var. burnettii (strain JB137-S8 / ATCC MYA-4627 / FGSC 10392) TaxID=597362 RepID=K5WKU8_AGABU|nr:uncharacterized protein AGABI1DRAFT_131829 [Agaricus bisporus var. burnettii JB137-S8]EKM75931.1 hypothetical protein AGABI1DRAFT_131829 [Agaricus bisporus var. burnettii JB137-S8]